MPVRTERQGHVTTVVLSRPEARNAVDRPTAAELIASFREFDADDEARVAVLWGEGGTFCAGADLKALGTERGNRVEPEGDGPMGPTRLRLSKPVIAAVAGHAVAGGLELALWCDLRVAEEDAVFGVFCRRWGVPLIDGGTVRLPRLIGTSRALDLILTGRPVTAAEAHGMGLVNRLVSRLITACRDVRRWRYGARCLRCLLALRAGTTVLALDCRRAALATGHGRSTMHRAQDRLTLGGWLASRDSDGPAGTHELLPVTASHPGFAPIARGETQGTPPPPRERDLEKLGKLKPLADGDNGMPTSVFAGLTDLDWRENDRAKVLGPGSDRAHRCPTR
ncbi:hypothetical protein GCM10010228_04910 [Streptomyces massasporeus]|nr:hypothetical protein GCM10010228_04910 [Streptomyces massasporeus]